MEHQSLISSLSILDIVLVYRYLFISFNKKSKEIAPFVYLYKVVLKNIKEEKCLWILEHKN